MRKAATAAIALACAAPEAAHANPKPLPMTYPFATQPQGHGEVELYGDLTPLRALSSATGEEAAYARVQVQAELEYGLLDRLELGLYVAFTPDPGEALTQTATQGAGGALKQRLRGRFADEGDWPVDLSLYFEVAEALSEVELEAKVNLAKRVGGVHAMINASAEVELYYDGHVDWVLSPSGGLVYEAMPELQPGLEYWAHVELADAAEGLVVQPNHYVGPTLLLSLSALWWSAGGYFRVNDVGRARVPGEAFGPIWIRTVAGVDW